MKRFTNNTSLVVKEAQKELFLLPNQEKHHENSQDICILFFAELPHFQNEKAFFLLKNKNEEFYVIKKIWHKTTFFQKNTLGIYNLDRLFVETRFLEKLETTDKNQLNEILARYFLFFLNPNENNNNEDNNNTIEKDFTKESLVLDGTLHILKIFHQNIDFQSKWYILPENSTENPNKILNFIKEILFLLDKYLL